MKNQLHLKVLRELCGGTDIYWIACIKRTGRFHEGANLTYLFSRGPSSKKVHREWKRKGYIIVNKPGPSKGKILITHSGMIFMRNLLASDKYKHLNF